eukprot:g29748.t1
MILSCVAPGEVWRLQRNVTVLELGCGNGQVTYNLNTVPGVKCLGLDGYKGIQSLGSNYQQQPVLVAAAQCAFCAFVAGGPAVTWGDAWAWSGDRLGGDSSAVRERLAQGVRGVQSTSLAFAALLEDRSVVTWGDVNCGGDSRHVEAQLCDVEAIQSNNTAFAALKTDGTVVAWGQATSGGTLSPELLGAELAATWGAFAALDACGRVAAWGAPNYGGRVADAAGEGAAKVALAATNAAFAALDATGGVVAWGDAASGGEVPAAVQEQLQDVQHIQANSAAFVAIRKESRHPSRQDAAFAALLQNETVVCWGSMTHGGNCRAVQEQLVGVLAIQATSSAFVAILRDGPPIAWGNERSGGDNAALWSELLEL